MNDPILESLFQDTGDGKSAPVKNSTWSLALFFVLSVCVSVVFGGLGLVKNNLYESWAVRCSDYKWMVLVEGDPVQVDEVGRFLKQLDGVNNVRFMSSSDVYQQLSQEPMLAPQMGLFGTDAFPATWVMDWVPSEFDVNRQQNLLGDIKKFTGVLDVAFDQKAGESIQLIRRHWLEVRVVLSLLTFLVIGSMAWLLGRLFFVPLDRFHWKSVGVALISDELGWIAGLLLLRQVLGGLPWAFYTGGFVVGFLHYIGLYALRVDAFKS